MSLTMRNLVKFIAACVLIVFPAVCDAACPTECSKKTMYVAGTTKANFLRALVLCKEFGMELASIKSLAEETALENYMNTIHKGSGYFDGGFWLSGTRWGAGGVDFVWLSTGQPLVYRKFGGGQPDNAGGTEACVEFVHHGGNQYHWNDVPCHHELRFICERTIEIC